MEYKGLRAVNTVEHPVGAPAPTLGHPVGASAHYSSYRCAILFLLHEQESYGHELAARLADIGFDPRLVSSLDTVLASMEYEELVVSWEEPVIGTVPPKRVYRLTRRGHLRLSDSVPVLIRRCDPLGGLVGRYLAIRQADYRRRDGRQQEQGKHERRASAPW